MAPTTDDAENLLSTGQDENIDIETHEDLNARPVEQLREDSKRPQPVPEDKPEEEPEEKSETESAEPEEKSETEPAEQEEKPEAESEAESEEPEESTAASDKDPDKPPAETEDDSKAAGEDFVDEDDDYFEDDDDDYFEEEDDDEDFEEDDDDDDFNDEDDEDPDDDEDDEGGMGLNLFTLFVLLIAASITAIYYTCTVRTVHVRGNSLYTSEEIAEQVISDDSQLMHNTVFLTALYMTPKAPRIPFEESVKVSLNSYDTITITVKDMKVAGFIPYAGKNLYFSADGVVLENTPLTVKDATFVTGLSITGAQIGTKMTSDDEVGLGMVLEVLQILRKYEIKTDCIVLTESGSIVMYMDEIKVILGRSNFELKISKIAQILPYLEGRSGTINMTNYTSSDQNIILK